MDRLSIEDAEDLAKEGFTAACMANVPSGEKLNSIGKQLADTMRENERLHKALVNARHILRVENLLESWSENTKIIDEVLRNKESADKS